MSAKSSDMFNFVTVNVTSRVREFVRNVMGVLYRLLVLSQKQPSGIFTSFEGTSKIFNSPKRPCGSAVSDGEHFARPVCRSASVPQVAASPKLTLCRLNRIRSPTPASKRYKHVRFFAPPRPCKNTLRGDCTSPLRFLNSREQSGGTGSSPFLPGHLSPPMAVSTNS